MKLDNQTYDIIKWLVITVLPALVLLLNTVLPVYGVSNETVQGITITITAVTTFLGTVIGVSSVQYNKEIENGEHKG